MLLWCFVMLLFKRFSSLIIILSSLRISTTILLYVSILPDAGCLRVDSSKIFVLRPSGIKHESHERRDQRGLPSRWIFKLYVLLYFLLRLCSPESGSCTKRNARIMFIKCMREFGVAEMYHPREFLEFFIKTLRRSSSFERFAEAPQKSSSNGSWCSLVGNLTSCNFREFKSMRYTSWSTASLEAEWKRRGIHDPGVWQSRSSLEGRAGFL